MRRHGGGRGLPGGWRGSAALAGVSRCAVRAARDAGAFLGPPGWGCIGVLGNPFPDDFPYRINGEGRTLMAEYRSAPSRRSVLRTAALGAAGAVAGPLIAGPDGAAATS